MPDESTNLDATELAAWRSLLRAHSHLVTVLDKELTRQHGLGLADFDVLRSLAGAGESGQRMTELAREVLLSPSGLTRRLDGLVKSGMAERRQCPNDGRGLLAVLTSKGAEKLQEMQPTHSRGVRSHFTERLSAEDLRKVTSVLEALSGADGVVETDIRENTQTREVISV